MGIRQCFVIVVLICLLPINVVAQSHMLSNSNLPTLFYDDGDGFIVIAHRGASAYYPENTMAAFKAAVEMNAEMIELDVLLSKDGVPVVFHDIQLDDHTNGDGYIFEYTLEELKQLDAGSWFGQKFAGERIPTLEEVLQFVQDSIALNIEIKTEAVTDQVEGGVEEKSLALVKKYGMQEHVLFSSFDYRAVRHLKELDPDIPVALLYNRQQTNHSWPHEQVKAFSADAFNCSYRQYSDSWSQDLNEHKIPHFIYTVNSRRKMKKLITAGVTGIFTDKPDLLRQVKQKLKK